MPANPTDNLSAVGRMLAAARSVLGTPYVWGGSKPGGFDCSGLVQWAYGKGGITTPRTSQEQFAASNVINPKDARIGDLVFFRNASHVGIYLGNGKMLHAPHTGDVVKIADVYAGATYGRLKNMPNEGGLNSGGIGGSGVGYGGSGVGYGGGSGVGGGGSGVGGSGGPQGCLPPTISIIGFLVLVGGIVHYVVPGI